MILVKKKYLTLLLFIIFITLPGTASAETSCCSENGGVYACDYSTSKLYCKDGTVSSECTCSPASAPTRKPTPKSTPTPSPPKCPDHSVYDAGSKICRCSSGYIVKGNECVSFAQYCWSKYGDNSEYDSSLKNCTCASGYTWDTDADKCISMDAFCHSMTGSKSYYNKDNNSCDCYSGYSIQDNKCRLIPTQIPTTPQKTTENIITHSPTPSPSPKPTINITRIPTPSPTESYLFKISPATENFTIEKKTSKSFFEQLLENIWNFIINLF